MRKPSHSPSNGQEIALEGFDVQSSVARDNTPKIAPQPPKLAIVYGTCCRCKKHPAVLKSPSGNPENIYCAECGRSRCGVHTIADFELEESTGIWLDPCCFKHTWKQQSLTEVK
jgi:hypothetical protein